jgi:hypothetical protein
MPCSYRIDAEHHLIVGLGTGVVTKEDIIFYLHSIANDPAFDPTYDKIEYTCNVTELQLSNRDLQEIAGIIIMGKSSRRALVAGRDLIFGVFRMFEVYRGAAQEGNFSVFRTVEDAMQWINEKRLDEHVEPIPLLLEPFPMS